MIRAILMDFNGVIINDEPLHCQAYQQILKNENINLTEEDYYRCAGMNDVSFVRQQFKNAGLGVDDEKVKQITDQKTVEWRKMIDKEIPIFETVENFIKKCEKRFALGVVSMARREEIEHILMQTGLADSFSIITAAEDVETHKPDPECYLKSFKKLDSLCAAEGHYPLVHRECLVIEDTPQGIQAAKSAGMKVLAVTNTFDEETLRDAGADSVTANLNDWMPESIALVF
ncbi:MAG: HAD family hydrolase [Pyrinomonadaceae bacterium]